MEDGDIRKPKQLPPGPERWVGSDNWMALKGTINFVVVFGPAFLFFVVMTVGTYLFSENTHIQENALGDLLMKVPRIEFDVGMFTSKGGAQYGQKCLFLWELLVVCMVLCFLADIWLFRYVTNRLDYNKLGPGDVAAFNFALPILTLLLIGFFWSDFSLYKTGRGRGLQISPSMFWYPALVMLMLNMLVFYSPLYIYLSRKKKSASRH